MRNDRFGTTRMRPARVARLARGFSLSELMVVVLVIAVLVSVAVPSFTVIARDIGLSQARSDIYAALAAARGRAIRDRRMVALHIFRDGGQAYAQNPYRWGQTWDGAAWVGIPHVPTNKLTMRLEEPRWRDPVTGAVEFVYNNDHDPIILPDGIGVCQPNTDLAGYVDVSDEVGLPADTVKLPFFQDFYIVFADDGKLATVLVDYNCHYDTTTPGNNTTATVVVPGGNNTWSASGLCMYDARKFAELIDDTTRRDYVNRPDNTVIISPYTGMPMSSEAVK